MHQDYYYIITRNGSITEIPYSEENYKATYEEWIKGGRLIIKPNGHDVPIGINAVDITNIFTRDAYKSYVHSSPNVKQYIRKGIWYDTKQHREVRVEPHIAKRRAEQKSIAQAPEPEITPAQRKQNLKKIREIKESLRHGFTTKK